MWIKNASENETKDENSKDYLRNNWLQANFCILLLRNSWSALELFNGSYWVITLFECLQSVYWTKCIMYFWAKRFWLRTSTFRTKSDSCNCNCSMWFVFVPNSFSFFFFHLFFWISFWEWNTFCVNYKWRCAPQNSDVVKKTWQTKPEIVWLKLCHPNYAFHWVSSYFDKKKMDMLFSWYSR